MLGGNYSDKGQNKELGGDKMSAREKLRGFLEEHNKTGKSIEPDEMYIYFRLLTQALAEDKRWKDLARLNREKGYSASGEAISETVQDHISIDVPLLGARMLSMEKRFGDKELDDVALIFGFGAHDIAEALTRDKSVMLKTKADDKKEDSAFNLIISHFAGEELAFFQKAYDISGERAAAIHSGLPISSISKNGRFFWAVEVIGYLTKAFFEVEMGNKAFISVFYDHLDDIILLSQEFRSFRELINPLLKKMQNLMRENPYTDQTK